MLLKNTLKAATAISLLAASVAYADTLTIATVNNGDMIRMQGLTDDFTSKTGHNVEWVTLKKTYYVSASQQISPPRAVHLIS